MMESSRKVRQAGLGFHSKEYCHSRVAERIRIKGEHRQANNYFSHSGFLLPLQCLDIVELQKRIPKVWVVPVVSIFTFHDEP